jgi:hypothetical protein
MNLEKLSFKELLAHHTGLEKEWSRREIKRTSNNFTGDLAEYLFLQAFRSWDRQSNSNAGFDAIDNKGVKYQIKGRRCTEQNKSRQLGAIRNLKDKDKSFNVLAAVIFSEDYGIKHAALIPYEVVKRRCSNKLQIHTNSHRFLLTEDVWNEPGVKDITEKLRRAVEHL